MESQDIKGDYSKDRKVSISKRDLEP